MDKSCDTCACDRVCDHDWNGWETCGSWTPVWISVEERLPETETQVLVLAERSGLKIITDGMYEDGTVTAEDSFWCWYEHDFEYDEEKDSFIIPEGWWEYKHYNGDDEFNHPIDDVVTHWMPLPEPPKEVSA